MLASDADAQDAVQEAFLSAFRALDGFDGQCRLGTWLHRVLLNACLMRLRSRHRRPEQPLGSLLPEFLDDGHQRVDSQPWRALPVAELECAELRRLVRDKIEELPMPYREVILLRDIEELDTAQTASLLRTTPGALKTRLHRARQALRTLLEPHFVEVSP
jgi:RNA polymerase sigma-70 factor, ECF subfamily